MSAVTLVASLQVVAILTSVLLAIKLFSSGLHLRYRIFFVYFVFRIPYLCASWYIYHQYRTSAAYLKLFLYTEPVVMVFYVLVVLELYRLVLERYKGLYTLGQWAMYIAIGLSVTISFLALLPKIKPSASEPSKWLFRELAVERGVDLSLVLFILLIFLFLSRYPVPLSRNVIVHISIYSLFFLSETLVLLLRTLFNRNASSSINAGLIMLSCACSIAWLWFLSAKGEEVQINAPHIRPESEERVLQQLDALNQTLLKASRK